MTNIYVVKEVTFDCCHMLSSYDGACSNLHGHTYRLQIELSGAPVGGRSSSDSAMVMDFKDLKKIIQEHVIDKMDHALVLSSSVFRDEEEDALLSWAKEFDKKYYVVPGGRSTAETMSRDIFNCIMIELINLELNVVVSSVKLWETPTSYAECRLSACEAQNASS